MRGKCIVLVDFLFRHNNHKVEGSAALFFNKGDTIPMTDQELLKEIQLQYGYEAFEIIHRQKEKH